MTLPDLPAGWHWTTVEKAGRLQLGRQRAPKHHDGPNMRPYLRVANVFEDRIDTTDVMQMNFDPEEFERYRLYPGDILLNEGQTPDLLGRPAMYQGAPSDCAFTNSLIRFQAGVGVLPEWALLVFRAHMHSGRFKQESRITTNIAHLSAARLRSVEFPVPPIEEQQLRAQKFAAQDAGLTQTIDEVLRFGRGARAARQSAVRRLVDDLSADQRPHVTLKDVADWQSGGTPSSKREEYYGGDIPWAIIGDLKDAPLATPARTIPPEGPQHSSCKWVPAGAVLVAMYGASIGKLAITRAPMTTNQAIAAATPRSGWSADFLFWYLYAQRHELRALGKGAAQPNIGQSVLKDFPVPAVGEIAQDAFVGRMQSLAAAASAIDASERRLVSLNRALKRVLLLRTVLPTDEVSV